jgi:hypothetical protein
MKIKIGTCKVCGWHGQIIRHKPNHCARYLKVKQMYMTGKSSRQIARETGMGAGMVAHAIKVGRVKARPPGGLNNPLGLNGRWPRRPPDPLAT